MKKTFFLLSAASVIAFASCKKEDDEPKVEERGCYTCNQIRTQTITETLNTGSSQTTTTVDTSGTTEECNKTRSEIDSLVSAGARSYTTGIGANSIQIAVKVSCVRK